MSQELMVSVPASELYTVRAKLNVLTAILSPEWKDEWTPQGRNPIAYEKTMECYSLVEEWLIRDEESRQDQEND